MIGALIGDIVGSIYEFNNIKTKDFPLLKQESHFTDDSVMTLAVAEIMQKGYIFDCRKIVATFRKWGRTFINAGYGEQFVKWLASHDPRPYRSYGNGAAMRVSPVAWYADSALEVQKYARAVTEVTHNHPEGLKGAEVTAMCIYYARISKTKQFIKNYAEQFYSLDFDYEDLRRNYFHDEESCQTTVPQAIYCFLISDGFEDCLRTTVSIGGDCDTTAAISGAIAEAYYKKIDRNLMLDALSRLPAAENGCDALRILSEYAERKKFVMQSAINLTDDVLKSIENADIKAVKIAVPGAMGAAGEIYLIVGSGENILEYRGNVVQWAKTYDEACRKIVEIRNQLRIDSAAFVSIYMGFGNFLYIHRDLEKSFRDEVKNMQPSKIYSNYRRILRKLLKF